MTEVEKFFLETLPKNEEATKTDCSLWLHNYYREIENEEAFHSKYYDNQDQRMEAMFSGMPKKPMDLLKLKAYKHRADHHEETGHEDRIIELETEVQTTEYAEFSAGTMGFWNS